jgi:hypothetical protein
VPTEKLGEPAAPKTKKHLRWSDDGPIEAVSTHQEGNARHTDATAKPPTITVPTAPVARRGGRQRRARYRKAAHEIERDRVVNQIVEHMQKQKALSDAESENDASDHDDSEAESAEEAESDGESEGYANAQSYAPEQLPCMTNTEVLAVQHKEWPIHEFPEQVRRIKRIRAQKARLGVRRAVRAVKANVSAIEASSGASSVTDLVYKRFKKKYNVDFNQLTNEERARYYSSVDTELDEVEARGDITCSDTDYPVILKALDEMACRAADAGMTRENLPRLRELLVEHVDTFRLDLCNDAPVRVTPVKFKMRPDLAPWKFHSRKYSAEQKKFLSAFTTRLLDYGLIYVNNDSAYSSPIHLVKKKGVPEDADILEQFRATIDLRKINAHTVAKAWPMFRLDDVQESLRGSKFYCKIDLKNAYWGIPVDKDHQDYHSFSTHEATYSSRRLTQGTLDGGAVFQAAVYECLGDLISNGCLSYIDDILIYAATEDELLDRIEKVLKRLTKLNFKISAAKCAMYQTEVSWCGYVFSSGGKSHDPERVAALEAAERPRNGGHLWQFTAAVGWLRECIPEYHRRMRPLLDLQNKVLEVAASRKKRRGKNKDGETVEKATKRNMKAAESVELTGDLWTPAIEEAWNNAKLMLKDVTTMAHPDPHMDKVLFCDACDTGWGAILTQRPVTHRDKPWADQLHEPLAFLSKAWDTAAAKYSTTDQEAMAIFLSVKRLSPMMHAEGVADTFIMTDHANLVYLFDVAARGPVPTYTADRLERAACYLQRHLYVIKHIDGASNLWADLLSRWACPKVVQQVREEKDVRLKAATYAAQERQAMVKRIRSTAAKAHKKVKKSTRAALLRRITPTKKPDDTLYIADQTISIGYGVDSVVWPTYVEISKGQQLTVTEAAHPNASAGAEGDMTRKPWSELKTTTIGELPLLTTTDGRIWLPATDRLRTRVCVLAHCSAAGHRGENITLSTIKELFWWPRMTKQVRGWVRFCLGCSVNRGGKLVPRPTLTARHATKRNELLHFDFLKMPESTDGYNSILVLKDDLSMFTELEPHRDQSANAAATSLMNWFSRYGIANKWQSDGGGHFKNKLIKELAKKLNTRDHHFTMAAAPWTNGTVEVLNTTVLNTFTALLQQKRMDPDEWPTLLPDVVFSINHTRVPRLAGYTPAQVFMASEEGNPLKHFFKPPLPGKTFGTVEKSARDADPVVESYEDLVRALDIMHKEVAKVRHPANRPRVEDRVINFEKGDWVHVARVTTEVRSDKLTPIWQGPVEVSKVVSDYRYQVRDRSNLKQQIVHAARLRYYADGTVQMPKMVLDHIAGMQGKAIDRIHDFRKNPAGVWQVQLAYCGDGQAMEWVTLKSVARHARLLLRGLTRRKNLQGRKDLKGLIEQMDKHIPKQNRRAQPSTQRPRSSGLVPGEKDGAEDPKDRQQQARSTGRATGHPAPRQSKRRGPTKPNTDERPRTSATSARKRPHSSSRLTSSKIRRVRARTGSRKIGNTHSA